MGYNEPSINWKSDKREEMALDWTYFEENRGWHWTGIHRVHRDEVIQGKPGRRWLKKKQQRWERPGRK
jgi:hypothetical protein